ncbi:MAG: hemerythrin domain-containing protein, partial [Melioribacteraceae bacterium]
VLITHFRNEEKLMKENTFPGYYTHKLEHDRFYLQLTDLTNGFIEGARPFGTEQLTSIKQWFFNHIEINDRKCGNFLRDKGIIN